MVEKYYKEMLVKALKMWRMANGVEPTNVYDEADIPLLEGMIATHKKDKQFTSELICKEVLNGYNMKDKNIAKAAKKFKAVM